MLTKNQTLLRALIDNAIAATDQMRKGILSETEFADLLRQQEDEVINRLAPEPTPKQKPMILTVWIKLPHKSAPIKNQIQCNYIPSWERDSVTGSLWLQCSHGSWAADTVLSFTIHDNPIYVEED